MTEQEIQLVGFLEKKYSELIALRNERLEQKLGRNMEAEYVDYEVIEANKLEDLKTGVKRLLEGGWRPAGGVCMTRINIGYPYDDVMYSQAMVKPWPK